MDLYFKESGHKNHETILFLHGSALGGWMWDKQLEYFSNYHCLIPDLPEHGKNINMPHFSMENATDIVIDLIKNKAHNGRAHVVGFSLGAQIIVEILSKSPEIIDHAFISGTLVRSIPTTPLILNSMDYILKEYLPVKDTDFFIKANIRSYNFPKEYFNNVKQSTKSLNPDSLQRILHENLFFRIPNGLEVVNNSVLIIAGGKEYSIIKESAKYLAKSIPNSQAYIAPGMVNVWNLVDPEFFNRILGAWINDKSLPDELIPIK
ncbi:MAG: alpha/beta hydrolase [Methanobacteriaceae archaeon]|nr:alpha/beta hydrolase [Methanobacteriaceae archaeon]